MRKQVVLGLAIFVFSPSLAAQVTPVTTSVFTDFSGIQTPDPQIAVSKSLMLVVSNNTVDCFTKSGRLLSSFFVGDDFYTRTGLPPQSDHIDPNDLSSPVSTNGDIRTLYDSYRSRFWVLSAMRGGANKPFFNIAVSKTNDPRDGWYGYQFPATSGAADQLDVDYPSIGIDANGFYATINVYDHAAGSIVDQFLGVYNANDMANGLAPSLVGRTSFSLRFPNGTLPYGVIHPAVQYGVSNGEYLVGRYDSTHLAVWKLQYPFTLFQTITSSLVAVQPSSSIRNASQFPGYSNTQQINFTNLGNEIISVQSRNDVIYAVGADGISCGDGIVRTGNHLFKLDATTTTPTLKIDRIFGCASSGDRANTFFDYGWPAVGVNAAGDIGVVSVRSSSSYYLQVRASAYYANETDIRSSSLMFSANTGYSFNSYATDPVLRYADLAGASVDPYDDTAIWFVHEAPVISNNHPNNALVVGKLFGYPHPDLVTTTLSISPTTVTRAAGTFGGAFLATFTVANDGDGTAVATNADIYLTDSSQLNPRSVYVGSCNLPSLPPTTSGNGFPVNCVGVVPSTLAAGAYKVGIYVDRNHLVSGEYNTANNTKSSYVPLQPIIVQ